jgi:dynein heavy chain 1, cytosolic
MESLQNMDGIKGNMYYIDPKVVSKEKLYGTLDGTTLEWTDGIFTSIVRKILDNQTGESERRHWVAFDGDVDPHTFCSYAIIRVVPSLFLVATVI